VAGETLESFIVAHLAHSATKVAAADLLRHCVRERKVNRVAVQAALKHLASEGQIQYTNLFGTTQVDLAWSRPRWVSPRILLCPQEVAPGPPRPADSVVARIAGGAAFGAGDHPTTRLALHVLDTMFAEKRIPAGAKVLDIGTGTGVLAIGAVLLGAGAALALDIDPCALWEARGNVALNDLVSRIRVCADPVEDLVETFDLVLANLRLPTLLRLTPTVSRLLSNEGAVVISGIRPEESGELLKRWSALGLKACWIKESQGWTGIGFCRISKTG
jgi:ribosomal protein L11 methyltransferase